MIKGKLIAREGIALVNRSTCKKKPKRLNWKESPTYFPRLKVTNQGLTRPFLFVSIIAVCLHIHTVTVTQAQNPSTTLTQSLKISFSTSIKIFVLLALEIATLQGSQYLLTYQKPTKQTPELFQIRCKSET